MYADDYDAMTLNAFYDFQSQYNPKDLRVEMLVKDVRDLYELRALAKVRPAALSQHGASSTTAPGFKLGSSGASVF
jgi:hypothetical protein